jgi:hypothetical protein
MPCNFVFCFISQYRVAESVVLNVCIEAGFSVPSNVIAVITVAFMIGYTCVCACVL